MFVIQKLLWYLVLPLPAMLGLIAAGLFLRRKNSRLGTAFVLAGVLVLYILSLGHTANFILRPLEGRYPPLGDGEIVADAVIVPGGGSVDLGWIGAASQPNAETLSRLVTGARLAGRLGIPLVLCGGNGEPFSTTVSDAETMFRAALALGVPRDRLILENASRNTVENSYAVRALIKGDRIVLATSAYYMRRAKALFEKRGFTVIPAPTGFLAQTRTFSFASFIPGAANLQRSSVGIAEWISMAYWRLRGEI